MLEKIQKLTLCFLWQNLNSDKKPHSELREWFNKERHTNSGRFFSYLVEPVGKIEKYYCLSADSKDENTSILEGFDIGSLNDNAAEKIPFNRPSGPQSPQIGPVIKRSYSSNAGPGPSTKILNSTIKSFKEKAEGELPWSDYFKEAISVFTREKLCYIGEIIEKKNKTAFDLAIDKIPEQNETVFLIFKDNKGKLPGEVPEYIEYLNTMIDGESKYSTLKSPGQQLPYCPLCNKKNAIVYASGCSAAGINIFNIDREGAFAGITNVNAHLSYAICADCADLLYIFKFHIIDKYITYIAGHKALVIPDVNLDMKSVSRFIQHFQVYAKGLASNKIEDANKAANIEQTQLLRVLADSRAVTTIDIIWADFGQKVENIRGIITDILPSRLRRIYELGKKFDDIINPVFPKYKIETISFDVNLSFLFQLFKRPGGKKAKKINESKKLFKLKKLIAESIYKKKNIPEKRFWEETMITARWYLFDFFDPETSSFGILNEGYSDKMNKKWLTFAGWIRHLAMALEYFKYMEVMNRMDNKRTYIPASKALGPYFNDDCGINTDYKAFAFILGILYGRVMSIQGAKGVNVGSNALTWLKRLTLSGKDLPELFIKVREKLLAYNAEGNERTREIIHELGTLGFRLGNDIKLDQIECCYFLLLGQSISVDIFPKEIKIEGEEKDERK